MRRSVELGWDSVVRGPSALPSALSILDISYSPSESWMGWYDERWSSLSRRRRRKPAEGGWCGTISDWREYLETREARSDSSSSICCSSSSVGMYERSFGSNGGVGTVPSPKTASISSSGTPMVSGYTENRSVQKAQVDSYGALTEVHYGGG